MFDQTLNLSVMNYKERVSEMYRMLGNGQAMEAFENYYDPYGSRKSSLKHLLNLWDEAFNNDLEGYRDEKEKKIYYDSGVEQITSYHKHYCADGKYFS